MISNFDNDNTYIYPYICEAAIIILLREKLFNVQHVFLNMKWNPPIIYDQFGAARSAP